MTQGANLTLATLLGISALTLSRRVASGAPARRLPPAEILLERELDVSGGKPWLRAGKPWLRVQRRGSQLASLVIPSLNVDTSDQDEQANDVYAFALADEASAYGDSLLPACREQLRELMSRSDVRGLYVVGNVDMEEWLMGRGVGFAMYEGLLEGASRKGFAISPHWCAREGHTSELASRVWRRLASRNPHVGDLDYMRAIEDEGDEDMLASLGSPIIVWRETWVP